MPYFTKNTNTSRYFFRKLLDMFFPIKMTVYENSKVLNTRSTAFQIVNAHFAQTLEE